MITAYVLIQTEVGKAGHVASAAAEIDGVHQVQPLAGPYDVIVRAEARSFDALVGELASCMAYVRDRGLAADIGHY